MAALVVRCALVVLFLPFSVLDKVLGFEQALVQARHYSVGIVAQYRVGTNR